MITPTVLPPHGASSFCRTRIVTHVNLFSDFSPNNGSPGHSQNIGWLPTRISEGLLMWNTTNNNHRESSKKSWPKSANWLTTARLLEAFDTVPHQRLLQKIDHYGIRGNLKCWIESWLTERSQTIVINGAYSTSAKVKSGVLQGTVLGPLMFLLYINDIGDQVDGQMGLFTDDSALYGLVGSTQDAQSLHRDLDCLNDWAHKWQMSFNADKCSILRIYRCHNPIEHHYKIGGQELTTVQHHPYLGVELTGDLNWNNHISNIVGKANRTLGFVRRNLSNCPEEIKKHAYYALVRPHLEYASSVWYQHMQKQINDIEAVQRRAARFVKRYYDRTPGTVTTILDDLGWPTLQQRRK